LRSWYSWIIMMQFGVALRSITRLMWRATSAKDGWVPKHKMGRFTPKIWTWDVQFLVSASAVAR
jgi:hypothetical protein